MKYLVLGIILVLVSVSSFADEKIFKISNGILNIKNTSGDVDIIAVSGDILKISYDKKKWKKDCQLVLERNGDEINIEVKQGRGFFSSSECDIEFKIELPKKIRLDAKLGSGELSIKGIEADCELKTGSGDIDVTKSIISKLTGKSGSGDISTKGQFSNVDFKTGSGDISIIMEKIIGNGSFFARSGSGDVSIKIPKSATAKTNFKSGSGELEIKVNYSENPSIIVDVKTGSGDLLIESL